MRSLHQGKEVSEADESANESVTEDDHEWIKLGAITTVYQAATLVQTYRQTYGLKIATPHLTQILAISSFILLGYLPSLAAHSSLQFESGVGTKESQQQWTAEAAFEEVFRCLIGLGMHAMLPRGIARMVYRTAEQMHIQLPARVSHMMKIAADLAWHPKDLLRLSSRYPNVAIMDGGGKSTQEVRMEELLKKWEKLDVANPGLDQPVQG